SLPILKNVFLEARDNQIVLTTTNLEIAARATVQGKVLEVGKVTVPISSLSAIINALQTERLNLEKKGNNLEIQADNYRAPLQGLPPDEFPIIPKIHDTKERIEIKAEILKDALSQVLVATQPTELRPELNSVLLDFSIDTLRFVATDSFRLAEKTLGDKEYEAAGAEGFRALIPLKTAHEVSRILADDETVTISRDENQILFKTPAFELISRVIDGNFPDYTAIIPKKFGAEIVLSRQELAGALKLASVFGSRTSEVKISASENKRGIEISSAEQGVGENSYVLPAKIQGTLKETAFNWRYLLDALKTQKTEEVFFGVNEGGEPALLRAPKDGSYLYIVKPILKT
ncbi:MAG: DNA polymerase III subunit beta, partial [Patescibacteria group bacterium]